MTTEQKNIMIRAYIETESRKLNIKYPNLLSDEKVEHLIDMYDDSDKDYDEIIEEIDAIFNQFIDEYMELMNKIKNLEERGVSEEEIKRITEVSINNIKFKEEFGLHAFFDDVYDEVFEIRSLDVVDSNVSNINADKFFFSSRGYCEDVYITDSSIVEAIVKKAMMKNADKVFYLCDSSKRNKKYMYNICQSADVTQIINEI